MRVISAAVTVARLSLSGPSATTYVRGRWTAATAPTQSKTNTPISGRAVAARRRIIALARVRSPDAPWCRNCQGGYIGFRKCWSSGVADRR